MIAVADTHNDLLLACLHRFERGVSDPFGDDWLPGLRSGGVTLQVLPIFTEEQFVGEGALRRTLELIELAYSIADRHPSDVVLVRNSADLADATTSGRIALILALEGAEPVGSSLSLIDTFWRLGVRMASLTWNRRTMMADGIAETDTGGRLSSLGVEAISEMRRLGMVVDISHLSAPGVDHLASLGAGAIVASHSSCRSNCNHPRNLTDHQISVVVESGGFVAMNAFAPFIRKGAPASIDDYLDHVAHAATFTNHSGQPVVALGADFIIDLARLVDPILSRQLLVRLDDIHSIDGFARPADYQRVTDRLEERFGIDTAQRVASKTVLDFFEQHLPAA